MMGRTKGGDRQQSPHYHAGTSLHITASAVEYSVLTSAVLPLPPVWQT